MMRRRTLVMLSLLVTMALGAFGYLTGRWLSGPPRSVDRGHVAVAPPVSPGPAGGVEAEPVASRSCSDALVACKQSIQAQREEHAGKPVPWTPAIPDGYWPEDVRAVVESVREQCPDLPVSSTWVECGEYPCIVWFSTPPQPLGEDEPWPLGRCAAWPYGQRYMRSGASIDDAMATAVRAMPALPSGVRLGEEELRRLRHRQETLEARAQRELGVSELFSDRSR